jgi:adenylate cyclase
VRFRRALFATTPLPPRAKRTQGSPRWQDRAGSGSANFQRLRFALASNPGVLYGNIGGGNRLDFTCIGPAVNLVARLVKLSAQLGRAIVASGEFTRHCPNRFVALGEFALCGFAATQPAFDLGDDAP